MHAHRATLTAFVLATVTALGTGCTPVLDHVDSHPSLDHATLRDGGVAALPAISYVAEVDALDGQLLLMNNARSWRDEIPVGVVANTAEAAEIAQAVELGEPIPREATAAVSALSDARFIAVSILHDYTTRFTEVSDTVVDSDGFTYTEVTLTAEGELDGELMLVDGESGEIWWHGDHVASDDNEVRYDDGAWFPPAEPAPPSAFELTDELFEAMVRNWPRKP